MPQPNKLRFATLVVAGALGIAGLSSCGAIGSVLNPGPPPSPSPQPPAKLVDPLLFQPVTEVVAGECPTDQPNAIPDRNEPAACLILEPSRFEVTQLVAVSLQIGSGDWTVSLELNEADAKAFADVSAELSELTDPQNRLAMVLDDRADEDDPGELLTAPVIVQPITGGRLEVSGFTRGEAEKLIDQLGG